MNSRHVLALLHLASPALPVGAFSYSQGLEWEVSCGRIHDEEGVREWLEQLLQHALACWEAPLVMRLVGAWGELPDPPGQNENLEANILRWNAEFLAGRETAELRAETVQMGYSCCRVLPELFGTHPKLAAGTAVLSLVREPAYPIVWSLAAALAGVLPLEAGVAYLWSWLENQVMAAVKLVPLGQSAGQRLLAALAHRIPALADAALTRPESDWSNLVPGLALASSLHETQYSRLFRS